MASPDRSGISSITDIARIAGVSVSTVSRALTGKGTLRPETRERIRAIADQHGFRMNVAAQNLRLGRTGAIAVLLPLGHEQGQHLFDPFLMAMIGHLADRISQRDYDLTLSRIIPRDDQWLGSVIASGRVDGIIVIGQSDQSAVIEAAAADYAPMVVWGASRPEQKQLTVGTDNVMGGRMAGEHLLSRGRGRLAFFGNPGLPEFGDRYAGFLSALPPEQKARHRLVSAHLTPEISYATALEHFRREGAPDGIFAASDVIAMSAIRALSDCGLSVPGDASVVGFDDIMFAAHANPPITTIRQDVEEGAAHLCDLLFRRMAGEDCDPVVMEPRLVIRQSS